MIRDIAVALQVRLRAKGCPISVVTSAERGGTTTGARERIVIEHDYDASDAYGFVHSQRANPKHVVTRTVAAKLTIYAQSAKAGAQVFEHHRRADLILDAVLACMDRVARDDLQIGWRPAGGRFIRPEDLEESERLPGAVYALSFTVDRAVRDVTWQGEAKPEAELTDIASTTQVRLQYGPEGAPVETGCGG